MAFAKLFEHPEHGQILVKLDQGTDGTEAEVRFYVEPPNLGVCSCASGFDGDDAWERAEAMFNDMDEAKALAVAIDFLKMSSQFAPKG